jgi:hypothetical protein
MVSDINQLNIKEIDDMVKAYNKKNNYPMERNTFIDHALRYIYAIRQGRMICSIGSVSKSGMSRTIKFLEMSKGENRHFLYNFYQFFDSLGYTKIKDSDYFRIGGCGMDMIFHTNYTIMHDLRRLGFINKEECDTLAQATPHIV